MMDNAIICLSSGMAAGVAIATLYYSRELKEVLNDKSKSSVEKQTNLWKEVSQKNRENGEDKLERLAFFLVGVLCGGILERLLTYLNSLLG